MRWRSPGKLRCSSPKSAEFFKVVIFHYGIESLARLHKASLGVIYRMVCFYTIFQLEINKKALYCSVCEENVSKGHRHVAQPEKRRAIVHSSQHGGVNGVL